MKYSISIRAEVSFVQEIDAPSPEEARERAVRDILRGSDGEIYEHAYEAFDYSGFDAWSVVGEAEDEQGKLVQFKPWNSWE